MKHLCAGLVILGLVVHAAAAEGNLTEARQRWLHGNYEEARELYEAIGKNARDRDAAAIGLSRTWQSQGEYDRGLAAVDNALKMSPGNADLHARRAELLYLRGQWEDAEKSADRALELRKDHLLARWIRGQVFRDRGELDKALPEFRWFIKIYNERVDTKEEIKRPEDLLLVGLAGSEETRWRQTGLFMDILDDLYDGAVKIDKDFWPAEYHAGMLLLEKYNYADALTALDKTLTINPNAAEALVAKGIYALQKFELKDAEQLADRALKINPLLVEALNLRADVHLAGGDTGKAMKELQRARQVNPRDEYTLGRVAACLFLQQKPEEFQKVVKEVEGRDAKPGVFYFVLAEQIEERRRFDEAEKYYKKSTGLWPMLPWSQNGLGMLYMRMGREKEARDILVKAFEADPFNVRVSNTLKVLEHLDSYTTLKTKHFHLRYDPMQDEHLARFMAKYLEEIYADLAEKFKYRPEGPILVEVFNNHEKFSGRVIALPDLHTIGACTGRMVAMVSPRGRGIRQPFNWARVLRHELVHIFNLEQTHFQIPHWYTEGLAVINEGFPRPQRWNQLLLERVPRGELMNLDDINLGFIRPRSPLDWHMAYCQSQLYVEYMKEKYGPQAVGDLLQAFGDGLDTPAAIARVCKVDKAAFEKGYRAYLDDVVKSIRGKAAGKPMTLSQLQEAHEKEPANADVAAQLAEQFMVRRRTAEARKLVDAVLAGNKTHPLASLVKARLFLAAGDEDQARRMLEAAAEAGPPEPKVLQAIGKLCFDARDFTRAARYFELARKTEPFESQWLIELAKIYTQAGEKEKLIGILKDLVPTDADDIDSRKRLARLLLDEHRFVEGERYAREALEVDVLDVAAEQALGDALLGQKKYQPAIDVYKSALAIDEKADSARLKLAQAYMDSGQNELARNEVARVLARDPDNADAKRLRALLEK